MAQQQNEGGLSVDEASLDRMIQDASAPSLADLFRKAKEQGLVQPVTGYGEGAPGSA